MADRERQPLGAGRGRHALAPCGDGSHRSGRAPWHGARTPRHRHVRVVQGLKKYDLHGCADNTQVISVQCVNDNACMNTRLHMRPPAVALPAPSTARLPPQAAALAAPRPRHSAAPEKRRPAPLWRPQSPASHAASRRAGLRTTGGKGIHRRELQCIMRLFVCNEYRRCRCLTAEAACRGLRQQDVPRGICNVPP